LSLWERVSYYLIPAAVDAVLEFVGHSSSGDSSILFDYAVSLSDEDLEGCYGVPEFVQSMKKHHPTEIFNTTINESEIESYLEQRGLKLVRHTGIDEIENTCLLDDHGALIGSPTGLFRFVLATPAGS
jgi:O-methyltransferase involved in polyketide biosynthesis